MKKILVIFLGLFALTASTQAQKKSSGAIQFVTTTDPAALATASGMQLSDEMKARMPKALKTNFELLFTATNASYMPVVEVEDSNGNGDSGRGIASMMMRFGGAIGAREYYYVLADQKLVEVVELNDTTYVMQSKLTIANSPQLNLNMGGQRLGASNVPAAGPASQSAVQFLPGLPTLEVINTDETKKIIGFDCKKVIIRSIRKARVLDMDKDIIDETAVWYTNDLGFNFSPNPNMWTEGAVLALENKGNSTVAKSIEYRGVSAKDVTAPKKAFPITQEEYAKKMENMVNRMRSMGGARPGASGTTRNIIIN